MVNNKYPSIPVDEYPRRWEKVQGMMAAQGLDLLIAYADDHAVYGTAHARWLANVPVHFEAVCILFYKDSAPIMLCGPESDEYAILIGQISDVHILKEFTHPDEDYEHTEIKGLAEIVSGLTDISSIKKVGVAGKYIMPYDVYVAFEQALPSREWVDVEADMCKLRSIKTKSEIEVIKFAYKIAEIGITAAIEAIRPGVTERAIAAAAESAMRGAGSEGTGIDTIVASGLNTRPILARSTFREVESNDLVLLTVAPRYEGYHGAIGRPVLVGDSNPEVERAIKVASEAQHECYQALKVGIDGKEIEAIGRAALKRADLEQFFLYSGIHSVGVIEFEAPIYGPSSEGQLQDGMIMSIDIPMFNAPWGGLRVEDGFHITEPQVERLSNIPYEIRK